jgi:hypothetical protein
VPEEEEGVWEDEQPVLLDLTPDRGGQTFAGMDIDMYSPYASKLSSELIDMLKSNQIPVQILNFSGTSARVGLTSHEAPGGISTVATALHAFIQRNKYRLVTAKVSDRKVPVNGFSREETETLLREAWEPTEVALNEASQTSRSQT